MGITNGGLAVFLTSPYPNAKKCDKRMLTTE